MDFNLEGKTALVCGASKGIGAACAHSLAEMGAHLILLSRDLSYLEQSKTKLPYPERHLCISADMEDLTQFKKKLSEFFQDNKKKVSILICNSGGPKGGPLLEAEDEAFFKAFSQHILAYQYLVKQFLPHMQDQQYGRIINIISTSVKAPISNLGVSNTIRAAVANWAKTLSLELARWNITVNNVLPGYTDTERLKSLMENASKRLNISVEEVKRDYESSVPLKRFARPEEVSAAVAFLASPAASYITGINLPIDGGRTPSL